MSADPAKKLQALVKKLKARFPEAPACALASLRAVPESAAPDAPPPPASSLIDELVFSSLLWEASTHQALEAWQRINAAFIDLNELRVSYPNEVVQVLGDRYPWAEERTIRLRCMLQDIYRRQHKMDLQPILAVGKREARSYIESLEGCHPFVAARVTLFGLSAHAVPLDDRLLTLLRSESAAPHSETSTLDEACTWLERQFRSGEGAPIADLLQAWSDKDGRPSRRDPLPANAADATPAKKAKSKSKGDDKGDDAKPEKPKKAAKKAS